MSLERQVWRQIRAGRNPDPDAVREVVGPHRVVLGSDGESSTRRFVEDRLLGAGPLEPLLGDVEVTDIAVNGDGSVWVDRGFGMERAQVEAGGPEARRRLAVRLAGLAGRRLDETVPYVDGQLPSGVRLHAVLPPLVPDGPHVTLRIPARRGLDLDWLERSGTVPPGWGQVLRACIERRLAFVVTGGTGAGKTTVLGALLSLCSPQERLVVVEDVRELAIDHPHVVRLQARPANVEGAGEVPMTTLVRQALRMRPDRLVVGEVRGAEVRELLAALNTGHEGGCGTVHANAPQDVVARFEALGALAGMTPAAVQVQVGSALAVVVHVVRQAGCAGSGEGSAAGARRSRVVQSLGVVVRSASDRVGVDTAVRLVAGRTERGPGWPLLAALTGVDDAW